MAFDSGTFSSMLHDMDYSKLRKPAKDKSEDEKDWSGVRKLFNSDYFKDGLNKAYNPSVKDKHLVDYRGQSAVSRLEPTHIGGGGIGIGPLFGASAAGVLGASTIGRNLANNPISIDSSRGTPIDSRKEEEEEEKRDKLATPDTNAAEAGDESVDEDSKSYDEEAVDKAAASEDVNYRDIEDEGIDYTDEEREICKDRPAITPIVNELLDKGLVQLVERPDLDVSRETVKDLLKKMLENPEIASYLEKSFNETTGKTAAAKQYERLVKLENLERVVTNIVNQRNKRKGAALRKGRESFERSNKAAARDAVITEMAKNPAVDIEETRDRQLKAKAGRERFGSSIYDVSK